MVYRAGVGFDAVFCPHAGKDVVHNPQGRISRGHKAPHLAQNADDTDLAQVRALPTPAVSMWRWLMVVIHNMLEGIAIGAVRNTA